LRNRFLLQLFGPTDLYDEARHYAMDQIALVDRGQSPHTSARDALIAPVAKK
jgi:hypothetical protein